MGNAPTVQAGQSLWLTMLFPEDNALNRRLLLANRCQLMASFSIEPGKP